MQYLRYHPTIKVPFPSSKCQKQHSILLHEASHVNVKTLKFKDLELTSY